jgi:hypothetical protein
MHFYLKKKKAENFLTEWLSDLFRYFRLLYCTTWRVVTLVIAPTSVILYYSTQAIWNYYISCLHNNEFKLSNAEEDEGLLVLVIIMLLTFTVIKHQWPTTSRTLIISDIFRTLDRDAITIALWLQCLKKEEVCSHLYTKEVPAVCLSGSTALG